MHALMPVEAQQAPPPISTGIPIFDDLYGNLTGREVRVTFRLGQIYLGVECRSPLSAQARQGYMSQAFEVDDVYNDLEEDTNDSDGESSSSHIHFIVIDAITPLLGPNLSAASSLEVRHPRERSYTLVLNASSQAKDGNGL
ncbi:hypothetical protein JOM56_010115 [Amanita muscaria]